MTAAPKEQPKTSEAMANELTWYDAPLPYGVRMGARRPKYQGYGLPKGCPQSRLSDIDECQETARLAHCPRHREGPLTEPKAGAQPRPQERVLVPEPV